ncbi:MAG: prolipoprotein diacylglyceryl transferase [Clostridia bacterium]|nr:prolipoprotein diacylglyceryl transferase [Clostridia bacterium]
MNLVPFDYQLPFGATWYGLAAALSALCAFLLYGAIRRRSGAAGADDLVPYKMALACIPAALVGARLSYCLLRISYFVYDVGLLQAFNTRTGGFLLYGAVFGAMGAAVLVAKREKLSAVGVLDDLAAPGMLAIMICRLAECTTTEGVGAWMENEAFMRFPIAVMNEWEEWQLAVFLLEALVAAVILAVLLARRYARGERIMTALLLYAACQVVCESLRMDSCLRFGFVRVSQVISAFVILAVLVIRSRRCEGSKRLAVRVLVLLACAGAVGGLEWALDKTEVSNVLLYIVMAAVSAVMIVNAMGCGRQDDTKANAE